VLAGPVEATALGNLLVQARTHGALDGDLTALRARVRTATRLDRYDPRTRSPGSRSTTFAPGPGPRPAGPVDRARPDGSGA